MPRRSGKLRLGDIVEQPIRGQVPGLAGGGHRRVVGGIAGGGRGRRIPRRGAWGGYRATVESGRHRLAGGDFLCAATRLTDSHFDAVITNPPYVRTQQLGGATAQMLSKQFGLSGRIDLTHPFVATIPRLLRPGGVLGLLCANRFLSTKAGANLRALLYAELTPVELYDLGDTRLFEAAVLPAVTIAVRGHEQRTCRFVTAYESEREPTAAADLFDAVVAPADSVVDHGGRRIAVETGTLWTGAHGEPCGSGTPGRGSAGGPARISPMVATHGPMWSAKTNHSPALSIPQLRGACRDPIPTPGWGESPPARGARSARWHESGWASRRMPIESSSRTGGRIGPAVRSPNCSGSC